MRLARLLIAFFLVLGVCAGGVHGGSAQNKERAKGKPKPPPKITNPKITNPKFPKIPNTMNPKLKPVTFTGMVVWVSGFGNDRTLYIKHSNGTIKGFFALGTTPVDGPPGIRWVGHVANGQVVTVSTVGGQTTRVRVTKKAEGGQGKLAGKRHHFKGKVVERVTDNFGNTGHVSVQNEKGVLKVFKATNATTVFARQGTLSIIHTLQGVKKGQTVHVAHVQQKDALTAANIDILLGTPFTSAGFEGWRLREPTGYNQWVTGKATLGTGLGAFNVTHPKGPARREFINNARGVDLYTDQLYGNVNVELEFMIPPGSNSGVYLMGRYEVQISDSYGLGNVGFQQLGAIYNAAAPRVNAAKKAGQWQKMVIQFQAPGFENGRKVSNAKFLKVTINGRLVHENVEVTGPTPAGLHFGEAPTGPLLLQGGRGAVVFRHVKITQR